MQSSQSAIHPEPYLMGNYCIRTLSKIQYYRVPYSTIVTTGHDQMGMICSGYATMLQLRDYLWTAGLYEYTEDGVVLRGCATYTKLIIIRPQVSYPWTSAIPTSIKGTWRKTRFYVLPVPIFITWITPRERDPRQPEAQSAIQAHYLLIIR